jgi:hypothetical protein
MSEEASQSENAAKKFDLRRARNPFVIENGVPVYKPGQNEETGRSWFPGYAVNVETGERLNIIFGEDSYLESENGRDMLWNPTNNNAQFGYQNPATLSDPQAFITRYLWGGKHWIWVMNSRFNVRSLLGTGNPCYKGYEEKAGSRTFGLPYDSGNVYHQILTGCNPYEASLRNIFIGAEWVMLPVLTPNGKFKSPEEGFIPTETTLKIRIKKPYVTLDPSTEPSKNKKQPVYKFSTKGLAPSVSTNAGTEALKEITITPNPYYAYSGYENSQLDNRVRIANLPPNCKVTIYNLEGSVIRRYGFAQTASSEVNPRTTHYIDWDLKNDARVPIASGAYIIHIDAGSLGQRIIKWFGIMRPIDLDTF